MNRWRRYRLVVPVTIGLVLGLSSGALAAFPGAQSTWNPGNTLVYRFTLQVQNVFTAQGLTGLVNLTWEAQNQ